MQLQEGDIRQMNPRIYKRHPLNIAASVGNNYMHYNASVICNHDP